MYDPHLPGRVDDDSFVGSDPLGNLALDQEAI